MDSKLNHEVTECRNKGETPAAPWGIVRGANHGDKGN